MTSQRKIKLGAFLWPTGHHIAAWRHPEAPADAGVNFAHFVALAQTAERGLFDLIFMADQAAVFFATLGNMPKALEYADRSLQIDPEDPMLLYNVSCTYAGLGKLEEAMNCLERAVDNGFGHKEWIDHDPDLNPLRENSRFQALSQAM